jgi:Tfp pilus assembly protein PilV
MIDNSVEVTRALLEGGLLGFAILLAKTYENAMRAQILQQQATIDRLLNELIDTKNGANRNQD